MNVFARIVGWAQDRNIIKGSTPQAQYLKAASEFGELADALAKGQDDLAKDGIGDTVVVLTIIAAQKGWTLEECVEAAYTDIKDRKGVMYRGVFVKESDPRYAAVLSNLRMEKASTAA